MIIRGKNTMSKIETVSPSLFYGYAIYNWAQIIDVREANEEPFIDQFKYENIPLSMIIDDITDFEFTGTVITFCNHGRRGQQAAEVLQAHFKDATFMNLEGGIMAWLEYESQKEK